MFTDFHKQPINAGDIIYKAQLWGKSARLERYLVVGFTPQKLRVVSCDHYRPYDRVNRRTADYEQWRPPKTIDPRNLIVLNDHPWPDADQYRMEHGL